MKENNKIAKIAWIFIIILVGALCMYRSMFGFDWSDETYYSAMAYVNLLDGHIFQNMYLLTFWSLILTPFVSIYRYMTAGTTEGILLFFRVCYNVLNLGLALYLFRTATKNVPTWIAGIAASLLLVFVPAGIPSLSYNTVAIGLSLLTILLIYHGFEKDKPALGYMYFSGLALGIAVVSYPTLGIALPLIPIYLIWKGYKTDEMKEARKWLLSWIVGLISIPLIILGFLLLHYSVKEIFDNLQRILNNLSSYKNGLSSGNPFQRYYETIKLVIPNKLIYYLLGTIAAGIISFIGNEKVKKAGTILMWMFLIILEWKILYPLINRLDIFYPLVPLALALPMLYFMMHRYSSRYFLMYLMGLFLSFAISLASNNVYTFFGGLLISTIAVLLFVGEYIKDIELDIKWKIPTYSAITLIGLAVLLSLVNARINLVYRDAPINELNTKIIHGPAAGLYTTRESVLKYEEIYAAIKKYVPNKGNVLFTKLLPFGYLCTEAKPATQQLWRTEIVSEELVKFYKENPDRIPTCVFYINENYGYKYPNGTYSNADNPLGGYLGKLLEGGSYKKVVLKSATIYLKIEANKK